MPYRSSGLFLDIFAFLQTLFKLDLSGRLTHLEILFVFLIGYLGQLEGDFSLCILDFEDLNDLGSLFKGFSAYDLILFLDLQCLFYPLDFSFRFQVVESIVKFFSGGNQIRGICHIPVDVFSDFGDGILYFLQTVAGPVSCLHLSFQLVDISWLTQTRKPDPWM